MMLIKRTLKQMLTLSLTVILASPESFARSRHQEAPASGSLNYGRSAECLARMAWSEARGEGEQGQYMVMRVAINRFREGWSSSICGVVVNGEFAKQGRLDRNILNIAKRELNRGLTTGNRSTDNAFFFHSYKAIRTRAASWSLRNPFIAKIGHHSFFADNGTRGNSTLARLNNQRYVAMLGSPGNTTPQQTTVLADARQDYSASPSINGLWLSNVEL